MISLPHNYTPRPYQLPLLDAMDSGYKRALCVWHRRSGKDKTLVNLTAKKTVERIGGYYYFFPTGKQGKKIIWDGMDKDGFKFLNHFPAPYILSSNDTEMKLKLATGSLFQIVGTDNYDSSMGTNPVGGVFSEYSLQNPDAWKYIQPILIENEGWAVFNFTPRGHNHAKKLYDIARKDPSTWFIDVLTVEDTGMEYLVDEARKEGMSDEMIQQEFYCSFNAPQMGAYYGKEMTEARTKKRIGLVPHDPSLPVHTFWDLGISDYMALWFAQFAGQEIHLIHYYQNCNEGMPHYVNYLAEKRDKEKYLYGEHWAPHDIEARELSTGVSRKKTAADLGIKFKVVPQKPLMEGIEAVRKILFRCWFNETNAEDGITCLENYRKQWNEKTQVFSNVPLHDEYSHGADAFRTLAEAVGMGAGKGSSMSVDEIRALNRRHGVR